MREILKEKLRKKMEMADRQTGREERKAANTVNVIVVQVHSSTNKKIHDRRCSYIVYNISCCFFPMWYHGFTYLSKYAKHTKYHSYCITFTFLLHNL